MSRDLEEFLRMAAARRRNAQNAGVPPMIEPEVVEEVEEVVQAVPVKPTIRPTIDTSSIQKHAAGLGSQISQSGESIEAKIHQKFDHGVGKLGSDDPHVDERSEPVELTEEPGKFAKLFTDPENLRNAIIMREIFERPKFED